MEENIAATTIVNGNATTENQTIKYTPGKAITLGNDTFYYIKDGHGDVRGITDGNGDTVVKYSYDAWGNLTSVISTASSSTSLATAKKLAEHNPYTYAGYYYDSDTGMYYLNARYYEPVIGRFISKDPIKFENLYLYAKNNPSNRVDPSGKGDRKVIIRAVADEEFRSDNAYGADWKNAIKRRYADAMAFYRNEYYKDADGKKWYFDISYEIKWFNNWDSTDEARGLDAMLNEAVSEIGFYGAEVFSAFTAQSVPRSWGDVLGMVGKVGGNSVILRYKGSASTENYVLRHEMGHLYWLNHNEVEPAKHKTSHNCFMRAYMNINNYNALCHVRHRFLIYNNRAKF